MAASSISLGSIICPSVFVMSLQNAFWQRIEQNTQRSE